MIEHKFHQYAHSVVLYELKKIDDDDYFAQGKGIMRSVFIDKIEEMRSVSLNYLGGLSFQGQVFEIKEKDKEDRFYALVFEVEPRPIMNQKFYMPKKIAVE